MVSTINLKGVVMEDFCNYREPSMFLITCHCNWKCCIERGLDVSICQNEPVARQPIVEFNIESTYDKYIKNDITKAIVFGGLEPLMQSEEVVSFIDYFRSHGCNDPIVIYTGYTEEEVINNKEWEKILHKGNIIMKYGRFIPDQKPHFDEVLGINLISNNQYAKYYQS